MGKEKKLVLSISLLASNRPDTIRRCLDSLKPILEQLPSELILVDTSESGEIHRILTEYTDQVYCFHWCNDFAGARNAGLKRASGEWFLFLDDDEWFEDVEPIVEFFRSGEYKEYDQAVYLVRNYSNWEGTKYTDDWVSRMIRLTEETRFEGKVHESLVPAVGKCKRLNAFAHHYGYVFATEEERQAHLKRNISLLVSLVEEEPNNIRWPLQLIKEYMSGGMWEELRDISLAALRQMEGTDAPFANQCRGSFYSAVLYAEHQRKEYDALHAHFEEFIQDDRLNEIGKCSVYLYEIEALYEQSADNWKRLWDACGAYLENWEAQNLWTLDEQQQTIQESIVLVNDAIEPHCHARIRNIHLLAAGMTGVQEESVQQEILAAESDLRGWMEGRADFLWFEEIYWKLGKTGIFPLEQILLSLPLAQWMAIVYAMHTHNDMKKWEVIRIRLDEIRTHDDIRYRYFYMNYYNELAEQAGGGTDPAQTEDLLAEFCTWNLKFAHAVYTEAAFEDDMVMLPDSCRAAVCLEQALSCSIDEWDEKLDALSRSVKAWPALADLIKAYARMLGEEKERRNTSSQQAQGEMQEMKTCVLQQIGILLQNGMRAEAQATLSQLSRLFPDDREVLALEEELAD
jgi:glycosyltransferase involved in cell wall biosynthesis